MNSEQFLLTRQPILDAHRAMVGYAFGFSAAEGATSSAVATADVVCKAFAELGLARALGEQQAFIEVPPDFLDSDLLLLLPPHTVVLVIDPAALTEASLVRCRELRSAGYVLAISSARALPEAQRELLSLASIWVMNIVPLAAAEKLPIAPPQTSQGRLKLLATGVDTPVLQAAAERLGFDMFQGHAFARPDLVPGRKLAAATQSILHLLNLLQQDAEAGDLEAVFKHEPALVANLLRLSNSAAMGLSSRINSIRQAIALLGRKQLKRWLQLLLFVRPGENIDLQHNPLLQLAALRGYFMELLVQRCYPARREMVDPAFIVGLLSVMPAALEMPMADILSQLIVTEDVRIALLDKGNALGQLLDLVERYDNGDTSEAAKKLTDLGARISHQTLNLCLTEAIAWMLSLDQQAA